MLQYRSLAQIMQLIALTIMSTTFNMDLTQKILAHIYIYGQGNMLLMGMYDWQTFSYNTFSI
jgi:hypothetical protein